MEDQWLTRQKVADRWDKSKGTLDQWAAKGIGPPYALFGRSARYRLSDLIEWENAQMRPMAGAEREDTPR